MQLEIAYLVGRFMEVTNSEQLYSCEGMLEVVKSKHTLRNVGCSIFTNSLVSGRRKQVLFFWIETIFKWKQTKKPSSMWKFCFSANSTDFIQSSLPKLWCSASTLVFNPLNDLTLLNAGSAIPLKKPLKSPQTKENRKALVENL